MSIAILGSGLVGMYVGLHLHTITDVYFVGRSPRFEGISLFTTSNMKVKETETNAINYTTNLDILDKVDVIIVSVKRTDLDAATRSLAKVLKRRTTIVTLMNGIDSVGQMKSILDKTNVELDYVPGIWSTNIVVSQTDSEMNWNQGSTGKCYLESNTKGIELSILFNRSGIAAVCEENILAVQQGKLLMNLNNPICALSGLPLWSELMTFEYRVLLSKCISEALEVYQEANIHPKALTPLPFWLLPYLLSYVPTVILQYLGRAIVNVDATATSSMYEDISNKRITEIDYLQGYIIELAEKHSIAVPHCQAIYSTIKEVEVLGNGITRYSADEIMNNFI